MASRHIRTALMTGSLLLVGLALITLHVPAWGLARTHNGSLRANSQYGPYHPRIKSFSVGSNETLTYPSTLPNLPDEHTTFIPLSGLRDYPSAPVPDHETYLVFASGNLRGGNGGTVVLETADLRNFYFASNLGYSEQVMVPPLPITICDPTYDKEFDENYAAPGTVLQDPVGPPGNFLMFYEAENHCPGGMWQEPYYATVGFANSSDFGRTWPGPANGEFGGPGRYPALMGPNPEPATKPAPPSANMGDALPSAFADRNLRNEQWIYVTYGYSVGPGNGTNDGLIRVARAKLDDESSHHDGDDHHLSFVKWYNGAFSQPGIGGLDSGPVPGSGCPGIQEMSEINYNDDLGLYLMIFVCNSFQEDGYGAWYYSTAMSLDLQDWTAPQLIENSRFKILRPCPISGSGTQFNGFHPSFMSPGMAAGHTRLTGKAFFLNGCDTGMPRYFTSRSFTITIE